MKKLSIIALLAASLAVSAQAVIVGASAGYLMDSKEAYYSARLGHEFKTVSSFSHIGELEIGYTSDSDSGTKIEILPVMINYRADLAKEGSAWGTTFAVGAGSARTSVKTWLGNFDDWAFAAQGVAGVTYQAGPSTRLTLGARYLWIGDVSFLGQDIEVGDDVALEVGVSFKF